VELFGVILMLGAGGALAIGIMIAIGILTRDADAQRGAPAPAPNRARIAASILFNLLRLGGVPPEEALRQIRRRAGLASAVTSAIDLPNWADRFAQGATLEQRQWLLDIAVQLVATRERAVPVRQYAALLDLSFSLGFQTDALAKLREQYGFDYVDHAKDARPREADRAGGAAPLFVRDRRDPAELLRILGIEGEPSRQVIVATYRRLATQHHPDKHGTSDAETQAAAAERFIEITRAYESLMAIYRD